MASFEELRDARLQKLNKLKEQGINPYPISSQQDYTLKEVVERFEELSKTHGEGGKSLSLVGRVMSLRPQGGLIFFNLFDGTAKFQGLLKQELSEKGAFELFEATIDMGDFVEVHGTLFTTKRGEKTLQVASWKMLAKSLRPMPEKWHGLQDVEERFRHRYLDTLMSEEVRQRFAIRSKAVNLIRKFFDERGYLEVETPRLQTVAGGATARPFVTHHNALDTDFYLTIAQELYLKMLLVGGFNRVYEIGRKFRNEGIDTTHNPEFTMLESQEAYADAASQRDFIEKLFKFLIKEIFGTDKPEIDGVALDFSKPFEVITFYDLFKKFTDIKNPEEVSQKDVLEYARKIGVKAETHEAKENIMDSIYKKLCRPNLVNPTFIIDYPVEFSPFAKRKEENPALIDRFQLVVSGLELVNAFSELNNPIDQKDRYLEQDKKGKSGEEEISPTDLAYIEAMEHGMPPNGGIGIGIDRLAMFLTGAKNIKEVIFFPTLKPKSEEGAAKKSKDTKKK